MARLLMVGVLVAGAYYIYQKKTATARLEQPLPPLPSPPVFEKDPPPILTETELKQIRTATKDADPQVRWAAIELLHRVRDPKAIDILESALSIDSEQEVRRKAIDILKTSGEPDVTESLVKALGDTEPEIRMAALMALGELGDPKATKPILQALTDTEPNIRTQALHTLGIIDANQRAKHQQMQEELKRQYLEELRQHEQKLQQQQTGAQPRQENLFDKRLGMPAQ